MSRLFDYLKRRLDKSSIQKCDIQPCQPHINTFCKGLIEAQLHISSYHTSIFRFGRLVAHFARCDFAFVDRADCEDEM